MCIQKITADDDFNDKLDHNVQHKVQNEMQYDVQSIVENSVIIPSKVKVKITKVINKYINEDNKVINNINEKNQHLTVKNSTVNLSSSQFQLLIDYTIKNWRIIQQSNLFKILFKTTQPAHIIGILAGLCIASTAIQKSDTEVNNPNQSQSKLMSFIYFTSFILHMGSQFWMTFVSGLSLYFALPRRDFSQVQVILFPRYFTINACFSITTLLIFLKYHSFQTWNTEITIQVSALFTAFFLELFIRLYFTPSLIGLIKAKNAIESAAGVGTEVGLYNLGPLENCPHYLKMSRAFRKIHSFIAIGNILTMVCTVIHLNYLVNKMYF